MQAHSCCISHYPRWGCVYTAAVCNSGSIEVKNTRQPSVSRSVCTHRVWYTRTDHLVVNEGSRLALTSSGSVWRRWKSWVLITDTVPEVQRPWLTDALAEGCPRTRQSVPRPEVHMPFPHRCVLQFRFGAQLFLFFLKVSFKNERYIKFI